MTGLCQVCTWKGKSPDGEGKLDKLPGGPGPHNCPGTPALPLAQDLSWPGPSPGPALPLWSARQYGFPRARRKAMPMVYTKASLQPLDLILGNSVSVRRLVKGEEKRKGGEGER